MTTTPDVRQAGRRVEQLLDSLTSATDPQLRTHAEELVRLLVEVYGTGLSRIISIITEELDAEQPDGTGRFADLLIADELVSGLLVLHGLHPQDVTERVRAVLDRVLPTLGSNAAGVELVGVDNEGVVRLRLQPQGGCGSSGGTVRQAIERAIADSVPDVTAVEVEEVARPKAPPTLIPVESLFRDRPVMVKR